MDVIKIFSERFKELKQSSGLGNIPLSVDLEISDASISRLENAKQAPSIIMLYKIAKYFKVSADYLIGLED